MSNKPPKGIIHLNDEISGDVYSVLLDDIEKHKIAYGCNPSTLQLSTYGGDAYYGLAIHDLVKSLDLAVVCSGPVMSAGIIIICGSSHVVATKHSHFMLHYGTSSVEGTHNDVQATQKHFKVLEKQMVDIIAARTGLGTTKLKRMLSIDTYLTAEQAFKYKLIDGIIE